MALGANLLSAFKINTGTWGQGAGFGAVVCGAGDGVEVDAESIKIMADLIQNNGLSGFGVRRPGTHGNKGADGDFGPMPIYYRGNEVLLACAMGAAAAPAQQGGTAAYGHALTLAATSAGVHGTLVLYGSDHPAVREVPFAKVSGFILTWEPNKLVMGTFPLVGFDGLVNQGALDADGIVTAVEPADGAQAIAGNPAFPFFVTILVVDADNSTTEQVSTIVGTDENGDYQTDVYTLSTDGKTWTSSKRWLSVTAVTNSAHAGTSSGDTFQVGYIPGINTLATGASISIPSSADHELMRFDQVKLWMNLQSDADFTDALPEDSGDLVPVESIQVKLDRALNTGKYTTRYGDRRDEPQDNAFKTVTMHLKFPEWDSYNNAWLQQKLQAGKMKAKITSTGPLAATGYPCELSLFLNNLQVAGGGDPNAGGPGEIPIEFDLEANVASSSPTGLPAWANTQPLSMWLVNLRTTNCLA